MKSVNYIYKPSSDLSTFSSNNVLINTPVLKNRTSDNISATLCSWNIFFSRTIISPLFSRRRPYVKHAAVFKMMCVADFRRNMSTICSWHSVASDTFIDFKKSSWSVRVFWMSAKSRCFGSTISPLICMRIFSLTEIKGVQQTIIEVNLTFYQGSYHSHILKPDLLKKKLTLVYSIFTEFTISA